MPFPQIVSERIFLGQKLYRIDGILVSFIKSVSLFRIMLYFVVSPRWLLGYLNGWAPNAGDIIEIG